MIYPGPSSLPAALKPGGVVIHVYAVPSCELLHVSALDAADDVDFEAEVASVLTEGTSDVCLVVYDGDTGDRMPPDLWELAT